VSGPARLKALRDEKDRWKAWHRFWLQLSIECARGPAAVALDQHQLGLDRHVKIGGFPQGGSDPWDEITEDERRWRRDVEYMIGVLALADYKLRYPKARGDRLWVYKGSPRGGGDIHCRFCGDALHRRAKIGHDYTTHPDVWKHMRGCALESLAGIRTAVPPIAAPLTIKVHVLKTGWRDLYGHEVGRCDPEGCDPDGDLRCTSNAQHRYTLSNSVTSIDAAPGRIFELNTKTGVATETT
jgi:hypothetical protein